MNSIRLTDGTGMLPAMTENALIKASSCPFWRPKRMVAIAHIGIGMVMLHKPNLHSLA